MVWKQKVSALCRARRWTPGVASHYLKWIEEVPSERSLVCLNRVSTTPQERAGNLLDQIAENSQALLGRPVVAVVSGVESSSIDGYRPLLMKAIRMARLHDAALVVSCRDRLLRHSDYDGRRCTEAPAIYEYETVMDMLDGVIIATILPPDTPSRGKQIKRGQAAKGNRGGPPKSKPGWKRDRRDELLPQVRWLRNKGWSLRAIAGEVGVPFGTVYDWLRPD